MLQLKVVKTEFSFVVFSYLQLGFLCQHQESFFIKLDHAPDLQELQQNL